ncbi:MAG: PAS domain S-box protein [bacterium]
MFDFHKIRIFRGIGRRLLLWFSLFFLIPLLTVSFTGYQQSKKTIRKQIYDHFESLLDLQKEALVNYLHQKEAHLKSSIKENEFLFISTVVLQSTTFSKGDIEAARNRVQKYAAEKKIEMGARNIWILGKNGNVIVSSDAAMLLEDHVYSPEFTDYQRDPAPVMSRYAETPSGPEILIFAPIRSETGEFTGLFTMSVNMEEIYRMLGNRTGLGESGETYLVNTGGYMISPSRFIKDMVLKQRILIKEILERSNWRTSGNYPLNYRGVPVIQAYTPFPFFGWTLIGEMETSEAFRDLAYQRNKTILIAIVLFSLLVIIAAVISETLTQPIRILVHAAKRVSEGDLNHSIVAKPGNELADLAFEFNRMTESIKESKQKMEEWNATIQQEVENRTQDLMKSELKFRNLMEKANDAIMIFNTGTLSCSLTNLKAGILTGYGQDELLGIRFFDFFLPEDLKRVKKHYEEALEKGSANLYNIPLRKKDGDPVFVDISNSLIEFQNQQFINCIIHDVTEQHKIERERNAVFQISDIIAKSSDLDTIIRRALDNILKNLELEVAVIFLYDQKTNELILAFQKGFSEAFMEKFAREPVTADTKRICTKTAFTKEMQYLQNPFKGSMSVFLAPDVDQENLQTVVSLPLIAEGTLVGVLQVITNRKRRFSGESLMLLESLANQLSAGILRIQLEQGKHQDDQFLASILTDSVDAIVSMDAEGRITSWNRGAEKIFHLNKEQAMGKPFPALFQNPDLLDNKEIHHMLHEQGFIRDYEIGNMTQDGSKISLHISITAIKDHSGKFVGSSAIIRDITEQREMQERIQQSEKLSSVGQLAAGIAHEIGTPLNIISGNAEYLMMDMQPDNPEMEELSIIIHQTERIAKLIQQLMDFARDTRPSFESTDIHQVIDNILTLVRHQLKKNNITLAADLNDSVPKIVADPNQLQQVFLNIIINAIQAMPDGGRLGIETSADKDEESVRIRISDTGHGIPKEYVSNIFNPFFTTKEVGQGTGLGLAVSHRIIENHRGKIEVESRVHEGTCFTVILPIHAKET